MSDRVHPRPVVRRPLTQPSPTRGGTAGRGAQPRRPRLSLEQLEDRLVPATINVNSLADILNPGPGVVTLRSAIQQVDTGTDTTNTINLLAAGDYKITLPGTVAETDNASGEFAITPNAGNLTIVNASGGQVTVDGNHLARVFDINPGNTDNPATKFTVTLQGFTITNGVAFDPANFDGPGSSGGGVRDQGNTSLTLNNVIVTRNIASADGGGVSMENAPASTPWTLTVNNSIISYNHAGDAGGGLETDGKGKVIVNGGQITGNTTVNQGAGIWLDAVADGVASVTVAGGTGYTTAPSVTFSAPQNAGGVTATGVATIVGGVVTGVTITNPGSGYTTAPTVNFSAPPAGTTATGTAVLGFDNSASLTITGTLVLDNAAENGPTGAIGNAGAGAVTITNCTIEYNFSGTTGGGFGDQNNLGTLTVMDSIFLGNSAGAELLPNVVDGGGGIQEGGPSTIIVSTLIQGNSSAGGDGGGVFATGGQLLIENSAIADNTTAFSGGGVRVATTGTGAAASVIVNTTIVDNSALNANSGNTGGGVDAAVTGTLTLLNDTINGNYATSGGGVADALGVVNVQNTIIAQNAATNTGPDVLSNGADYTTLGGNVIGNAGGSLVFTQSTIDQTGFTDVLLGPLQDNGGPAVGSPGASVVLYTEALLRGSPALARGVANDSPAVDARGFARPDVAGELPDVGAFEFQAGTPNTTFYIKTDHSLWEHTPNGETLLSGAGSILSISSVTDNAGVDDVYAVTSDHHLWEHTAAGWQFLSGNTFQQIAAATNANGYAVIFAVGLDNSLSEFTPAGSPVLSPAGTIMSISAVTDAAGGDDVFAITADHHLWEHTPAGWAMLSVGSFQQISAGLNGAGQAILYGVLTDNSLWEYNPAFNIGVNLLNLSPAGTILSISAGAADEVFAVTADHNLWDHKLAGWSLLSSSDFQSISGTQTADGHGEVFGVMTDSSLWEYNPSFPAPHWQQLVPSGVLASAAPLRR